MTTITFTDLQLRVTLAPWRKAQMPQWSERDWRMHLHDECVRHLNGNGKARVFGVTIEDLADRGMTGWDRAGVEAPVGDKSTTPRVGAGVTDVAAAPADPYEPVGTEAVVGDTVEIRGQLFEVKKASGTAFVTDERGGAIYGCDQRAPTYRILKRQAAPADPYEPVGTMPVVGDKFVACAPGYPVSSVYTALELCTNYPEVDGPVMRAEVNGFKQFFASFTAGSHWRILKRQAAPAPATAGLQVWRDTVRRDELLFVHSNGRIVACRSQGAWSRWRGSPYNILPTDTRLPAAEEAREIEAAREAGVL